MGGGAGRVGETVTRRCLARLAEFASLSEPSLPAPAMASDRKQIFRRVEMLVNKNKKSTNTESRVSGPFAASLLLAVAVVLVMTQPVFVVAAPAPAQDEPQVIVTPAAQPTPSPRSRTWYGARSRAWYGANSPRASPRQPPGWPRLPRKFTNWLRHQIRQRRQSPSRMNGERRWKRTGRRCGNCPGRFGKRFTGR